MSLYEALGNVEVHLQQIKLNITQEEDEIENLRDTLAQLKRKNIKLIEKLAKIDLEVQIGESDVAGAKVTKLSLDNEVGELKSCLQEHLKREEHVQGQLTRLEIFRNQKRINYEELCRQFQDKYLQIPRIAEYENINSVLTSSKRILEEKREVGANLQEELLKLVNSTEENLNYFVQQVCVKTAETRNKCSKTEVDLKTLRKEKDELEKQRNKRNMSLDERLTQFRKNYNLQGSVNLNSLSNRTPEIRNLVSTSAPKQMFQRPCLKLSDSWKNKPSMFAMFLGKNKITTLRQPSVSTMLKPTLASEVVTEMPSNSDSLYKQHNSNISTIQPVGTQLAQQANSNDSALMPPPAPARLIKSVLTQEKVNIESTLVGKRKEIEIRSLISKQLRKDDKDLFAPTGPFFRDEKSSTNAGIFGEKTMGLDLFGQNPNSNTGSNTSDTMFNFFSTSGSLF